ncbi:hypothetical protein M8J76_009461 [Diaphorina citri]|nr:hypothetical protein M8J76_009461 [Diaphorina citri]
MADADNVHSKPTKIKASDMTVDMEKETIRFAQDAIAKYKVEKDIAMYIKTQLDKTYEPTWHCIVGRNFGSFVTHESGNFLYFYLDKIAILV